MATCACPKCDAAVDLDPQSVPSDAAQQQCPECRGKFWTQRESFTLRAYKKLGEIYCGSCGHQLDQGDVCLSCGAAYPEYFVVQTTKPVQRKAQKAAFGFSRAAKNETVITARDLEPDRPRQAINFKPLALLAAVVLLVVLGVGASKYYGYSKARQEYSRNFVLALYGVRCGVDLCLQNGGKVVEEWNKSPQSISPRLNRKQLAQLDKVKEKIDAALDKLAQTPEEYQASEQKLQQLYQIYLKLKLLNESPAASLEELTERMAKLDKNFVAAARQLKNGMPDGLQDELSQAVARYRNLRFMVENG